MSEDQLDAGRQKERRAGAILLCSASLACKAAPKPPRAHHDARAPPPRGPCARLCSGKQARPKLLARAPSRPMSRAPNAHHHHFSFHPLLSLSRPPPPSSTKAARPPVPVPVPVPVRLCQCQPARQPARPASIIHPIASPRPELRLLTCSPPHPPARCPSRCNLFVLVHAARQPIHLPFAHPKNGRGPHPCRPLVRVVVLVVSLALAATNPWR